MRRLLLVVAAGLCAVALSSCSFWPFSLIPSDHGQADARMEQIAEAVEAQDADALRGLFSPRAIEQATDLNDGLDYFLSFFPNGGLTWDIDHVNSSVATEYGKITKMLSAYIKVTADGKDFWVIFKDFTVNELIDPDNVGLYGLGVVAWSDDMESRPVVGLYSWAGSIHKDGVGQYGYAGVYIPDDDIVYPGEMVDARMGQIAAALSEQEASALEGLFSARALQAATGFDDELEDVLSTFAGGNVTWDRQSVNATGDDLGEEIQLLTAEYKVSAGGKEYWLFLADYVVETIDPDNLGLAGLAVAPWTEPGDPGLDPEYVSWLESWIPEGEGPYGIYAPAG